MHLNFGLNRFILLRGAEAQELRNFSKAARFLLFLNELSMKFVLDNLDLLGLTLYGSALTRILLSFPNNLASIFLSNFEFHHLFDVLHLILIFIRVNRILLRLILVSATISISAYTRVTSSL